MEGSTDGGVDSFGAILRRYRGARGLTQDQLAERAGLHTQEISKLERSVRRAPRSTTVEFLAEALKLDASEHDLLVAAAQRQRELWAPGGHVNDEQKHAARQGPSLNAPTYVGDWDDRAADAAFIRRVRPHDRWPVRMVVSLLAAMFV